MDAEIDGAIDDLIEAASIEVPTKRAFELDICRKRLEAKINAAVEEAADEAGLYLEMGCG